MKNIGKSAGRSLFRPVLLFLRNDQVESQMFRMNPMMTHVECIAQSGDVTWDKMSFRS